MVCGVRYHILMPGFRSKLKRIVSYHQAMNHHFFNSNIKSKWACSRFTHIDIVFSHITNSIVITFRVVWLYLQFLASQRSIRISVHSFDEACRFEDDQNGWKWKIHHHSHEGWFVWSRMHISLFFKATILRCASNSG